MKNLYKIAVLTTLLFSTSLLAGCKGNDEWKENKASIMPQLMEGNMKRRVPLIINREISRDLDLGYVIDREKGYDFIFQYNLKDWEIDAGTLHKTAMRNFEKLAKNAEIQTANAEEGTTGRYVIIESGNGYDAVHLLSPTIRKKLKKYLGKEYIIGIPTRDFFIAWHKEFSLGGQFMEQVEKEFEEGDKYKLTPRLFLVSEDKIEPLTKVQAN